MKPGEQTLKDLMGSGEVWTENGNYIGVASDGVVVHLGDCRDSTIAYLAFHPKPSDW